MCTGLRPRRKPGRPARAMTSLCTAVAPLLRACARCACAGAAAADVVLRRPAGGAAAEPLQQGYRGDGHAGPGNDRVDRHQRT